MKVFFAKMGKVAELFLLKLSKFTCMQATGKNNFYP